VDAGADLDGQGRQEERPGSSDQAEERGHGQAAGEIGLCLAGIGSSYGLGWIESQWAATGLGRGMSGGV
jgi:hypothetical protein